MDAIVIPERGAFWVSDDDTVSGTEYVTEQLSFFSSEHVRHGHIRLLELSRGELEAHGVGVGACARVSSECDLLSSVVYVRW